MNFKNMPRRLRGWVSANLTGVPQWGMLLAATVPPALVLGRAVADIAVSAAALLFLCASLKKREGGWLRQGWLAAALILWAYGLLRAAFVPHAQSMWYAFVWLRYILFAAAVMQWSRAFPRGKRWLIDTLMLSAFWLSFDGLFQYVFGHDIFGRGLSGTRLTANYGRPILGITIVNLFAAPAGWLLREKRPALAAALALPAFAAIFLSGDRMGFLQAAAVMLPWLFFFVKDSRRALLGGGLAFAGAAALILVFAPAALHRQFDSTAKTVEQARHSPYALVWKSAAEVGLTHPLFGVGMHRFREACTDPRFGPVIDAQTGYMRCYTHPHNSWFEWFAEEGALGLLGFAVFVALAAAALLRRLAFAPADPALWMLAALVGMRLMPLFVTTSFFNNWEAIPFWLNLGLAMSWPQRDRA